MNQMEFTISNDSDEVSLNFCSIYSMAGGREISPYDFVSSLIMQKNLRIYANLTGHAN